MLLSVARKSGVAGNLVEVDGATEWKGFIGYDVLNLAAVNACDEVSVILFIWKDI